MTPETFADHGIDLPHGKAGEVDALCPRCSHTRKREHLRHRCLSVNTDDGTWFCHNCGWKGALRRSDWRDAPRPRPTPRIRPKDAGGELDAATLAWFAGRGISRAVLDRNRVRTNGGVIEFPYYRGGELVNVKYRRLPKAFRMVKDAELIPYGLDDCAGAAEIVFVEGELDKLAIEEATGRTAVLSVPNGAKSDLAILDAAKDVIGSARVVLAGDDDEPGRELVANAARRFGYERCRVASWPVGCKDANDALVECGPEVVAACLADARPYPVAGIVTVADLAADIQRLYDHGMPGGAATGWPSLDRYYTVREGQLTIVTGAPSSGKSVWLDALLVHLAQMHEWSFGVCSPEQQPVARHAAKLIAKYVGKPFGAGKTPRMTQEEKDRGEAWVGCHFDFVLPEENTVDAVIERARVLVARAGIRGFVLDPWTELDHSRPAGMTETEFIHESLTKIRAFGRNHGVHVWVVAHPTKLQKGADGKYPVATPYDISGSAGWFNKADNCLSLWRDREDETTPVQLHVQKVRFQEIGGLGRVDFSFEKATERYHEWRG